MFTKIEGILTPMATRIGSNRYLSAMADGFQVAAPLLVVSSLLVLIANLPLPGWTAGLEATVINPNTGATLLEYLLKPAQATYGIMALVVVLATGYSFAGKLGLEKLTGATVALVAWFTTILESSGDLSAVITNGQLGAKGILPGILVTFGAIHLYGLIEKITARIKSPSGIPPNATSSLVVLLPGLTVLMAVIVVNLGLGLWGTDFVSVFERMIQRPLLQLGDSLGAMLGAYLVLHLFWFFGANGGAVVGPIYNPILQTMSLENLSYFATQEGSGHIITHQFQNFYATFGGCGSVLSLIIAVLIFGKSQRIRSVGKLGLLPGIFGISEPIVFGLPIVLNPVMWLPFMMVPSLNILISYLAMAQGLVPLTNGVTLPWTVPVVISGFLTTNWTGALLQAFLVILGVVIYLPFVKVLDNRYLTKENETAAKTAAFNNNQPNKQGKEEDLCGE